MKSNDITNYSVPEILKDGRLLTIRAVRSDDRSRIVDTLRHVSSESFYRRVFSPKRELSANELSGLTDVDFANVVALVAVMKEEDQERIVGGGRFARTETSGDQASAEVAFLIDDAHQGLGIGSRIFKHLVAIARASGIVRFEAEVLPSNEGMLRLFSRSGLPFVRTMTRASVHLTIELAAEKIERKAESDRPNTSGGR